MYVGCIFPVSGGFAFAVPDIMSWGVTGKLYPGKILPHGGGCFDDGGAAERTFVARLDGLWLVFVDYGESMNELALFPTKESAEEFQAAIRVGTPAVAERIKVLGGYSLDPKTGNLSRP